MNRERRKWYQVAGAGALAAAVALLAPGVGAQGVPTGDPVNGVWSAPPCPMPNQQGTCTMAAPLQPLDPAIQPKFALELPVPVDYTPDKVTFPGMDYYEIQMSEVTQPPVAFPQSPGLPPGSVGRQWTGIVDAAGQPLYTPVWGYAQVNQGGGPLGGLNGGNPVATWPSMNFRATKGTPVKVKWVNNAPDQHLLCPDPANSDVPCAIDRTLMGTKVDVNGDFAFGPGEIVNPFGGPQQPDNAMVIHLHGGEIPPDSDGFAELWIGNQNTSKLYNPTTPGCTAVPLTPGATAGLDGATSFACGTFDIASYQVKDASGANVAGVTANISPHFVPNVNKVQGSIGIAPDAVYPGIQPNRSIDQLASVYTPGQLTRPKDNFIFYNYPMVQEAATIWYHDHALGKTRINVAAGPAGFFIVEDPVKEPAIKAVLPPQGDCSVGGVLGGLCYDIPIALQDRSFNSNGTINFPNLLGQANAAAGPGWNPLTPSDVATIHPQWVPEYFGDHAVVNGVIWPKFTADPRPYRLRLLGGSNARCWVLGMTAEGAVTQPTFTVIATEQGYVPRPITTSRLDMCPGERYEVIVDFSKYAGKKITLTNSGSAPYPNGVPADSTGFAQMAQVMRFDVLATPRAGSPAPVAWTPPAALPGVDFATPGPVALVREMVLNEVTDAAGFPVRVQIDGKAFEDFVTETPKRGSVEAWRIINTTVDAHPIHLHLVKFKVLSRQKFNSRSFGSAIGLANLTPAGGSLNSNVSVKPYLVGSARGPDPYENGWKDTVRALPGEVTTIVAKWDGAWDDCDPLNPAATPNCKKAPACQQPYAGYTGLVDAGTGCMCEPSGTPGVCGNLVYKPHFEPVTAGPYVWHCHIVDHEDNEMMRPTLVIP